LSGCLSLVFYCSAYHRDLHSFPTRRSSDLSSWGLPTVTREPLGRRLPLSAAPTVDRAAAEGGGPVWGEPGYRRATAGRRGKETTDRKSTRLNSSHVKISYAVFCLKKKTKQA